MAKEFAAGQQLPDKVLKMYRAVMELIEEGQDISSLRVSNITDRAGIGKGTAYEYFDTKDEIVAGAVIYHMQLVFSWIAEELAKRDSFKEQLTFLLDEVEKSGENKICFFRFVHMLTDISEFSQLIQQHISTEDFVQYQPTAFLRKVLTAALERGELAPVIPEEFMVFTVFSNLLGYMMAVTAEKSMTDVKLKSIRSFIYEKILSDLGVEK